MPDVRIAPLSFAALAACAVLGSEVARAATPLMAVRFASDITVTLDGVTVTPADVAEDNLAAAVTLVNVGNIPADAHIDAYHLLPNGDQLLSFDTTVTLPGGITAGPADVVRFNRTTFSIEFDAAANGVPEGANVDAVAVSDDDLVLSFDTSVRLGGNTFAGEDLVEFRGDVVEGSAFIPFFFGAAAGVPAELDLDGAQVLGPKHFLLSFDGSGRVGGVDFDDEDVLERDGFADTWELVYDGSAQDAGWSSADLVGLYAVLVPPTATQTATSTPSATATTTPTPSATLTPPPTATATVPAPATPTSTPAPTATTTAVPTATETATPTGTAEPTATVTPLLTPTPSSTPTSTPTSVPTATETATPSHTTEPTATTTPVLTPTLTATPTATATAAPTATPTQTTAPSSTATQEATATPTRVVDGTLTATHTSPPTPTVTPVATATAPPSATSTATEVPTATATPTPIPCVGDCNGSGEVTINELLKMVNIALGGAPVSDCPPGDVNGDGDITIDEILSAVNRALNGC